MASMHPVSPVSRAGSSPSETDTLWALVFCVSVAAGAYARLVGLGHSGLWLDEGWSLWFALHGSLSDLLRENHPPLYYLMLRGATLVLESDAALRATGAIASYVSVGAAYALGRAIGGSPRAGLAAASMVAVSGIDAVVARELRMYPWMTAAFGVSLAMAHRVAQGARGGWTLGLALACTVLLYLHGVGGYFVAGVLAFALIVSGSRAAMLRSAGAVFAAGAIYLPWFAASTLHRLGRMDGGLAWRPPPGWGEILQVPVRLLVDASPPWATPLGRFEACDLALAPSMCASLGGSLSLARSWWPEAAAALVVLLVGWVGWRATPRLRWRDALALLAACAVPYLLLAFTARVLIPFWDVRYLAPCAVPASVLLAAWALRDGRAVTQASVLALVALVAVSMLALPQQGTWEQWREAMAYLGHERRAGEVVVLDGLGQGAELLFERYATDPALPAGAIVLRRFVDDDYGPPRCATPDRSCLGAATLPSNAAPVAWLVRGSSLEAPRYPFAGAIHQWLDAHFVVEKTIAFQSVEVVKLRLRTP